MAVSISAAEAFGLLDRYGRERRPCFFAFDYAALNARVIPLDAVDPDALRYDLRGRGNLGVPGSSAPAWTAPAPIPRFSELAPPAYADYRAAFALARAAFERGESYLLNLTAASSLRVNLGLPELLWWAKAPYRLLMDDILVFSPECFVRIEEAVIRTFPMKGSLRCGLAAREAGIARLMADPKEIAEHVTVVDLLRNDLGRVAQGVSVPRFRYLEEIGLGAEVLLQTSSEIRGRLEPSWPDRLGSLLRQLLPAGSVTGAPKLSTCRHIERAEASLGGARGWYTGVFGVFDGQGVDSAVMIRFLRAEGEGEAGRRPCRFHSGGGLTWDARPQAEYRELVAKLAFPAQPLLFETLRVDDGMLRSPRRHAQRMLASARRAWGQALFPARDDWGEPALDQAEEQLREAFAGARAGAPALEGRWRFRLDYGPLGPVACTLEPYRLRRPDCLYLVQVGALDYGCKYARREGLEALKRGIVHEGASDWDILLCRGELVLEASYAALLMRDADGSWCSPRQPLLESTGVAALYDALGAGAVVRRDIRVDELGRMGAIYLVNAMLDLEDAVAPRQIRFPGPRAALVWQAREEAGSK